MRRKMRTWTVTRHCPPRARVTPHPRPAMPDLSERILPNLQARETHLPGKLRARVTPHPRLDLPDLPESMLPDRELQAKRPKGDAIATNVLPARPS